MLFKYKKVKSILGWNKHYKLSCILYSVVNFEQLSNVDSIQLVWSINHGLMQYFDTHILIHLKSNLTLEFE